MSAAPSAAAPNAVVTLAQSAGAAVNAQPRQYLNRLSDLCFVLARVLNRHAGGSDVLWHKDRNKDESED